MSLSPHAKRPLKITVEERPEGGFFSGSRSRYKIEIRDAEGLIIDWEVADTRWGASRRVRRFRRLYREGGPKEREPQFIHREEV